MYKNIAAECGCLYRNEKIEKMFQYKISSFVLAYLKIESL